VIQAGGFQDGELGPVHILPFKNHMFVGQKSVPVFGRHLNDVRLKLSGQKPGRHLTGYQPGKDFFCPDVPDDNHRLHAAFDHAVFFRHGPISKIGSGAVGLEIIEDLLRIQMFPLSPIDLGKKSLHCVL